jgi:hypothetical protein
LALAAHPFQKWAGIGETIERLLYWGRRGRHPDSMTDLAGENHGILWNLGR